MFLLSKKYLIVFISAVLTIFLLLVIFFFISKKKLQESLKTKTKDQEQSFIKTINFILEQVDKNKKETLDRVSSTILPLEKTMDKMNFRFEENEKKRILRDTNIQSSIHYLNKLQEDLKISNEKLKAETEKVVNALKKPNVRGKWGEVQLKNIAELSGMLPFCEFEMQCDLGGARPDMVVKLPNGGIICVDSKFPMEAYMQQIENENNNKKKEHSKAVKVHIYGLSNKKYWIHGKSPEMVILFIPIEALWLSAIDEDPGIFNYAIEKNVIVATPMTLVSLLKTIHFGWSQVQVLEEAAKLKKMLEMATNSFKDIRSFISDNKRNLSKINNNNHCIVDLAAKMEVNFGELLNFSTNKKDNLQEAQIGQKLNIEENQKDTEQPKKLIEGKKQEDVQQSQTIDLFEINN